MEKGKGVKLSLIQNSVHQPKSCHPIKDMSEAIAGIIGLTTLGLSVYSVVIKLYPLAVILAVISVGGFTIMARVHCLATEKVFEENVQKVGVERDRFQEYIERIDTLDERYESLIADQSKENKEWEELFLEAQRLVHSFATIFGNFDENNALLRDNVERLSDLKEKITRDIDRIQSAKGALSDEFIDI